MIEFLYCTYNITNLPLHNRGAVFNKITELYPTYACKEFINVFPQLIEECGYR